MKAKNRVISGDYVGAIVNSMLGQVSLSAGFKTITLSKNNVEQYELLDEEKKKSAASAVGRGLAGSFLLGPVGLLAGLSAKSKGIYLIAILFKDNRKSLLEVDDKIYKSIIKSLF